MKKVLLGFSRYNRFNEHMDCIKGCLDCLAVEISFPWLYGGTGQAFILNMNANLNVDAAQAWDIEAIFDLGPNLGWQMERVQVEHKVALQLSDEVFREALQTAWDFVKHQIDRGFPCYAWELSPIPNFNGIYGYETDDDTPEEPGAYLYKGYFGESSCRWDAMGTFDVKQVHALSVKPCSPSEPEKVVRDALTMVLERIDKPDGWAISDRYTTGLPAYEVWAQALESGIAFRDGHSYLNQVWLECREQAVLFLEQARDSLPGKAEGAFNTAIAGYTAVRDNLKILYELHPDREKQDWVSQFSSTEGALLVRKAAEEESKGIAALREILNALPHS